MSTYNTFLHGGDYNPEQWLHSPEILEKDIEYMKMANINEVTLGVFAWSVLEPEDEVYNFDWMEQIINRLYENNIKVMLATPSAARPKWLADKYEEVLRVESNRQRNLFGGRHNHCYTTPQYRRKVRDINVRLSKKFGNHPAVIAWHISNELSGECHCPLCQEAFRNWLKDKYKTIDALNEAWATTFWSHVYNDFSQVESPSTIGESGLHGLNLDWKRFVTDQTVDFVKAEKEAILEGGSNLPMIINMMYDYGGLNYFKFKDVVDIASWDSYPRWHKEDVAEIAVDTAMQHDFIRSLFKKPFLLMESCPSATNWQSVSKLKRPGLLLASSLQAVAHGSDSVQYFQIRQSRGSSEKFHGAVIDHYGKPDTRVFKEVTEIGSSLQQIEEICGSNTVSKVAIIFDLESRWAMEDAQGPRNKGLYYRETVMKIYKGLRKLGLNVDVINSEQSINEYDIVYVPMLYMFRDGFEQKARSYVEQGGNLVLSYWSGIVNETDLCYLGGTPYGLMDVFGLRSTEIDGLDDGEYNHGVSTENTIWNPSKIYTCEHLCDLVHITTATPILVYNEDFYKGYPVLTANSFGKGNAYYICADFEQEFYDDFCEYLVKKHNVPVEFSNIPKGIQVNTRETEDDVYVFIQNFNKEAVEMNLPLDNYSVLYGEKNQRIGSLETIVLKRKK